MSIVRNILERRGYWVRPKAVLPFGVDYLLDIQRMAAKHRIAIRSFFDIGAHEGQTAREALQAFPQAQVHSFEPHPVSFAHLRGIQSTRFHAHKLAMSDECGPGAFFEYAEPEPGHASMCNSLVEHSQYTVAAGHVATRIEVERVTVDAFCAPLGLPVDVLKIDTEGHELAVVKGAERTLSACPFVFLEYNTIHGVGDATGGALAPIAELLEPRHKLIASYPVYMTHEPLFATFNALFFNARHATPATD